jgi:hypothetical protein
MIDDDFFPLPIPIQHFYRMEFLFTRHNLKMGINYSILTILALFILLILKILIALLIKEKRRVCSNTSKKDLKMKTLKLNYLVNFQEKSDYYVLYIYI